MNLIASKKKAFYGVAPLLQMLSDNECLTISVRQSLFQIGSLALTELYRFKHEIFFWDLRCSG